MIGFIQVRSWCSVRSGQKGLSALEVPLMTGPNFAGGSGSPPSNCGPATTSLIVAITALVNSRHLLMGASLAPLLQHLPRRRVLPALFFMCEESWAMGVADARRRALGFSLACYLACRQGCTSCTAPHSARSSGRCWATSTPMVSTWPRRVPPAAARHVAGHEGGAAVAGQPGLRPPPLICWSRARRRGQRRTGRPGAAWLLAEDGMIFQVDPLDSSVRIHVLMAAATYLTCIVGFLALRNRTLSKRAVTVMEAAPGCADLGDAPTFVADKPPTWPRWPLPCWPPRG